MPQTTCAKCEGEIPKNEWSCPHCGNPIETAADRQTSNAISTRGMLLLIMLFIAFPVLLFLLHIFVPEL
ncbi:MAG: hypothetical protein JRH16_10915 [Deltaproteobacteria bacterium]|nr:hypothetical protein [Deltaproteobacteria bacterium]